MTRHTMLLGWVGGRPMGVHATASWLFCLACDALSACMAQAAAEAVIGCCHMSQAAAMHRCTWFFVCWAFLHAVSACCHCQAGTLLCRLIAARPFACGGTVAVCGLVNKPSVLWANQRHTWCITQVPLPDSSRSHAYRHANNPLSFAHPPALSTHAATTTD